MLVIVFLYHRGVTMYFIYLFVSSQFTYLQPNLVRTSEMICWSTLAMAACMAWPKQCAHADRPLPWMRAHRAALA